MTKEDIIRPYDKAIGTDGSIAVLRGNLAPEGAVIKHTACPKEMFKSVLRARPFDSEEECLDAVLKHKVQKEYRTDHRRKIFRCIYRTGNRTLQSGSC